METLTVGTQQITGSLGVLSYLNPAMGLRDLDIAFWTQKHLIDITLMKIPVFS